MNGEGLKRPPIWLMRQAGRYLPEYREVRAKAGSFLDLCYNPKLATEVTLQPIRRFGFDAAILFSDILVVADGLGQKVGFEEGRGPVLDALKDGGTWRGWVWTGSTRRLAPVYETVGRLRQDLPRETALIGFAGAPWTVASYMIEGGSSRDYAKAKSWIYGRATDFAALIALLVDATGAVSDRQVEAGAEVLQLFDSWAGALGASGDGALVPGAGQGDRRRGCAWRIPRCPFILFPRGVGAGYLDFARDAARNGLSLDPGVPLEWAGPASGAGRAARQSGSAAAGRGRAEMRAAAERILRTLGQGPFIFNLGHGIVPETPPEHVAELVKLVREGWR